MIKLFYPVFVVNVTLPKNVLMFLYERSAVLTTVTYVFCVFCFVIHGSQVLNTTMGHISAG